MLLRSTRLGAPLLVALLWAGGRPADASAQQVSVQTVSVERVTLGAFAPTASIRVQGGRLDEVTGAAVLVRGSPTRAVRVVSGRPRNGALTVSVEVVAGAPALEGELVLLTRTGSVATGVRVVVEAQPRPVELRTRGLTMRGYRPRARFIETRVLSMLGYRLGGPLRVRVQTLTMTGY
ncbi:MAG: hypothetical protein RJQ04_17185 [Longimicrobiales bacterium]